MNILILYSTTDGQTRKICDFMVKQLQIALPQFTLKCLNIKDFFKDYCAIDNYHAVILGASIRYGHHRRIVSKFINTHRKFLENNFFAFFSVNLTARKSDKNSSAKNPYMQKFYAKHRINPQEDAVFAGRIAYPEYRFYDRQIIRFIMKITNGPTDSNTIIEYTDWQEVNKFCARISKHFNNCNNIN